MGQETAAAGPDLSLGVAIGDIPASNVLAGRVGDEPVLLARLGDEFHAVSGSCTHYGAALADGLVDGETVRCPWHHACFSLRTGRALRAPALDGLDRWRVEAENGKVFVRGKLDAAPPRAADTPGDVERIVIIGGGAAGLACANELRALGFAGIVTMLSADSDPPVDRPNLSKDFLAGTAPADWMSLRPDDWYRDKVIDLRLGTEVVRIDVTDKRLHTADGGMVAFDRLLLATGSDANRLRSPGFDRDNAFTLRSFADARAIAARAEPGTRAVVIGSSFIGMEAAAALRKRGVKVTVVAPEAVPFEGVFGTEIGSFLKQLHEREGVRFHLGGAAAAGFDGQAVVLASGERIDADFVLVGIGARPRTALAEAAGLGEGGGIAVDSFLATAAPGIYAAGDIASYPDPLTGEPVRIEHWVSAERQGQVAAANMLGRDRRYTQVPFFWTEQYGVALRYVGNARQWDRVEIDGDIEGGDFVARYFVDGDHRASAGVGRDRDILEDERRFEERAAARAREPAAAPGIESPA